MSSSSLPWQASNDAGEAWRELPVVMNVATVSTDWVGEEPCWEAGETEELDMAEGGTTTRSVLTWCESALRV
jgi:hypothetical protein